MSAGVPWGSPQHSPPSSSYGSYPPNQHPHPNDPRRRTLFPQPTVQTQPGFYTPALGGAGGFFPPVPPAQSPLSSYPASPVISPPTHIPAMLKPGSMDRRPSFTSLRGNSNDLFFQGTQTTPFPSPQHYTSAPFYPSPPPLRHVQSSPPPPLPQKPPSIPPLPPKPFSAPPDPPPPLPIYPQVTNAVSQLPPSPQPAPAFPDLNRAFTAPSDTKGNADSEEDDDEFKKALELSAQVALESARQRQQTRTQEDEDIARAMKESLKLGTTAFLVPEPPVSSSSNVTLDSSARSLSTSPHHLEPLVFPSSHTSSPLSFSNQLAEDEAFARRLMEEETNHVHARSPVAVTPLATSPSLPPALHSSPLATASSLPASSQTSTPPDDTPPTYTDVVSEVVAGSPTIASPTPSNTLLTPSIPNGTLPDRGRPALDRNGSAPVTSPSVSPARRVDSRPRPSGPVEALPHGAQASPTQQSPPISYPSHQDPPLPNDLKPSTSSQSPPNLLPPNEKAELKGRPRTTSFLSDGPPNIPVNANQYVDQELLRGVSLGFHPPVVKQELPPLQGPIPNVVSLPYGRCPPFHLKASSWRDLIKLMARLSATRLEPTIEAMAVVKTEMRIRVVVNFVKVHHNTADWHVVLYMTIDQPVPQNHPQKSKYKNEDPSVLPFSYTMSSVPAYLREGADAPLSKWYSIPGTHTLAHPKLPVSFPDLATYLLDALEESRRSAHDGSSGMRRLAKLIETCYPADRQDERSGRDKGVGGWVRGLIGRDRGRSRDRNEHTFDVVTPFVPDEWGG